MQTEKHPGREGIQPGHRETVGRWSDADSTAYDVRLRRGRSCPCGCLSTPFFDDPACRSLLRVDAPHNADNGCLREYVADVDGRVRLTCRFDCHGYCARTAEGVPA